MKDINTTMYIICDKRGNGNINTLKQTKRECIADFASRETLWRECKKYGWKCKKVDVSIRPTSNI
ncbi:MAG: hypothetical protein ACM3ME_06720 [Chloroflexota bacterium]